MTTTVFLASLLLMKILAFAASNSSTSINKKVIEYATRLLEEEQILGEDVEVTVSTLDLNDYEMPLYSSDREEAGGVPSQAQDFYDAIGAADALVISFPEHNGHYLAAYKNLFDWTSRINSRVYQDKPTVMFATSPGGGGAASVLGHAVNSGKFFGNDMRASLSIPGFYDNFDVESVTLTNPDLDSEFRASLVTLG